MGSLGLDVVDEELGHFEAVFGWSLVFTKCMVICGHEPEFIG